MTAGVGRVVGTGAGASSSSPASVVSGDDGGGTLPLGGEDDGAACSCCTGSGEGMRMSSVFGIESPSLTVSDLYAEHEYTENSLSVSLYVLFVRGRLRFL